MRKGRSILHLLLAPLFMIAWVSPAIAEDAAPATTEEAAEPQGGEPLPEAMQHLVKAPPIDIENLRDPFASYLAAVAKRGRSILEEQRSRLANRPREPLESFDLATLKLVAIYKMGKDHVAMIQDSTGKGYVVRRGNYMGKNNGRIEKIDDETLYLVEQVVNPAGDIVDNQVTLTLKEVNE